MTGYIVRIVQVVSFCIYIHIYTPFYLTIDIIYDISLSQLQTKEMGGFINILVMYNNDVGKGGAYDYEAYEAK